MTITASNGVSRLPSTKASKDNLVLQGTKGLIHQPVTSGPWGGQGGKCWDDGVYAGIRQIVIRGGNAIDSIQTEYDKNGQFVWSVKHGGTGGFNTDKIQFDYPNETLICISGHYGSFYPSGPIAIRSLTFYTNLRKYGPYGVEEGTFFASPAIGSKIVGFHGRSGLFLDALGFYTQLFVPCCPSHGECEASKLLPQIISVVRDIVEAVKVPPSPTAAHPSLSTHIESLSSKGFHWTPVPCGAWGGKGGNPWDDGVYSGIRQIVLGYGAAIDYIHIQYDRNGHSVWSGRHGGSGGAKKETIQFQFPDEFLTTISGHYGCFSNSSPVAVRSLTFHTNRGKYGPYGVENGTPFSSPSTGLKILGFHGRSGWYLDAIGVQLVMKKPVDEQTNEEVENAWKEFVSRVIHQKVLDSEDRHDDDHSYTRGEYE
eukprot:Gb_17001 [translate_table: standard]